MKLQILDLLARDNPYKCINFENSMMQRDEILVKPEDTMDIVLIKAERLASIVRCGQSIAAALGETNSFAENEAKATFSPDQKRLYQIWKMGCEMPEEMKWIHKELQKQFAQDSDEEPPQKRSRKNDSNEEVDECQSIDDFCERIALGELFRLRSSQHDLISSKDVAYFRKNYEMLCPLLEAMVLIVRTKQGLGSVSQKLTKMRQEREYESAQQVLDALISQKRMVKAKADRCFEKVDQLAAIIRGRMRCYDPECAPVTQTSPTQDFSTMNQHLPEFAGRSAPVPPQPSSAFTPHGASEAPNNGDIRIDGHLAPRNDQHVSNPASAVINGRHTELNDYQACVTRDIRLPESNSVTEAAPSMTLQNGNKPSTTDSQVAHGSSEIPQNNRAKAADARSQAETQEFFQNEVSDQTQGQDKTSDRVSNIMPDQYDLDHMLPPTMRVNHVSPVNGRVRGNSLEAVQQSTPQNQDASNAPFGPQQENRRLESEISSTRSSSTEPTRPVTTFTPFIYPLPFSFSPTRSNANQAPLVPRSILKKPTNSYNSPRIPFSQPATITEIDQRNASLEHGGKENQFPQSDTSTNQASIKSVVHGNSLPFTSHQMSFF